MIFILCEWWENVYIYVKYLKIWIMIINCKFIILNDIINIFICNFFLIVIYIRNIYWLFFERVFVFWKENLK